MPPVASSRNSAREAPSPILLVEDNRVNQMVAAGMLRELGYEVDIAGNGTEGLGAVKNRAYGLILMDCQMPLMDGFEATKRLRAMGLGIPIVAMTANAMEGDKEACLRAGMDDYVAKPIRLDIVGAAVEKWLDQHHPHQTVA